MVGTRMLLVLGEHHGGSYHQWEQKEEPKENEIRMKQRKEYRQKVESELSAICGDIMTVIGEHLIPSALADESSVFYHWLKGNYYRYLAEFKDGEEKEEAAEEAKKAYETATITAEAELPPTNPVRLGLNFSVFYHEILSTPEKACHVAKKAFQEAIDELDSLNEESYKYKDSRLIMQHLRDNFTLWTSDLP